METQNVIEVQGVKLTPQSLAALKALQEEYWEMSFAPIDAAIDFLLSKTAAYDGESALKVLEIMQGLRGVKEELITLSCREGVNV